MEAETFVVTNTVGSQVLSIDQSGSAKLNGQPVLSGSGMDAYGVAVWGDPAQGASSDSGDEICTAMGLTCVTASTFPSGGEQACSYQGWGATRFIALCK